MTVDLLHISLVGACVVFVALVFYLGQRRERSIWIRSGRENRFMVFGDRRFFVFNATEFDIVDRKTAEVVAEAAQRGENPVKRITKAFRAFREEMSSKKES